MDNLIEDLACDLRMNAAVSKRGINKEIIQRVLRDNGIMDVLSFGKMGYAKFRQEYVTALFAA